MNTDSAKSFLESIGFSIFKEGGDFLVKGPRWGEYRPVDARKLISYAKIFGRNNRGKTKLKGIVKGLTHGKNRTRTRNLISVEDFDEFGVNNLVSEEDIWGWD